MRHRRARDQKQKAIPPGNERGFAVVKWMSPTPLADSPDRRVSMTNCASRRAAFDAEEGLEVPVGVAGGPVEGRMAFGRGGTAGSSGRATEIGQRAAEDSRAGSISDQRAPRMSLLRFVIPHPGEVVEEGFRCSIALGSERSYGNRGEFVRDLLRGRLTPAAARH